MDAALDMSFLEPRAGGGAREAAALSSAAGIGDAPFAAQGFPLPAVADVSAA